MRLMIIKQYFKCLDVAYLLNVYRDCEGCLGGVYSTVQYTGTGPGWQVSVGWLDWVCTQHCDQYTNVNIIVATDKHWSKQELMGDSSELWRVTCSLVYTQNIFLLFLKWSMDTSKLHKTGNRSINEDWNWYVFCPNTSSLLLALVTFSEPVLFLIPEANPGNRRVSCVGCFNFNGNTFCCAYKARKNSP